MAPGGIGNVYALDLRFEGKTLLADLDEVHPTAETAGDQDPYIRWDTGSTSASACSLLQGVAEVELPLGYVKHPTRQGISGLASRDGYFWDHIQEKHGSDHSPPIRCDAPGVSRLSAKEFKGRIAILFAIEPYPAVRNLKTRWHMARLGGALSAEVQRINSLASPPLPAPRKESHGMPPRKAHPGFVDTLIIIFVSVALVIFLLWAASRTAGINAFEHLPDWLQNSYRAMWTSIAAGTAGIGLAVFKGLTRKQNEPRPNYLLLIGGTTSFLIVVTLLLPRLSAPRPGTDHKSYVSGTVADAAGKAPISGIVVQLESDDGRLLRQDTTDDEGKFSLEIPSDVSAIQLVVSASGYARYYKKLPAIAAKNDIFLQRNGLSWGIADDSPMDPILQRIGADLNVTFVFSKSCSSRARTAKLNGGQVEADSKAPDVIAKEVISRVKDPNLRYSVTGSGPGRRYEIACH
jgi:Carboxypeptidase regulatory-like domain